MKYEIWGCIIDPETDAQIIESFDEIADANAKCEELNNDPRNHPDLHYWVDDDQNRAAAKWEQKTEAANR